MHLIRTLKSLSLLSAVLVVTACGGGGGGGTSSSSFSPSARFFNSVPDSTALDFTMNDVRVGNPVAYNSSTPTFQTFNPNLYDISVNENGQKMSLFAVTDQLSLNNDYVVVAIGEENFGAEYLKRAQIAFVPISRTAPNGASAQLYIVNGFEEAAGYTTSPIDFTNPGQNPTFSVTDIAPGASASLLVNSGSQDFLVRQNGSQGNYVEKVLNLAPGGIYLIVVSGINGDTGVKAPEIEQFQLQSR